MVSGLGAKLLDGVLRSPLYPLLLVPQARRTMVRTAQANGIDWPGARAWIAEQSWEEVSLEDLALSPPEYYCRPFHAYEAGNLCWEAAWEQELASKAVGARNFPAYRAEGEEAFRGAFEAALGDLGAQVPQGAILVDMGCGTGGSTRRLAEKHPHAQKVRLRTRAFCRQRAARGEAEGWNWCSKCKPQDAAMCSIASPASCERARRDLRPII